MCGIGGMVVQEDSHANQELLLSMAASMAHRGPDDEGVWRDKRVGLVHRRLSIIDLSANGHQPMEDAEGAYCIVFNGEIYNYQELRGLLPASPPYKSKTDTEVLLRAYRQWGPACLEKLNGMFAFAIMDKRKGQLFIARDRLGIKPLYYAHVNGVFMFASEVKALLAAGLPREFNSIAALDFAFTGSTMDERHLCRHVRRLPPGTRLMYDLRDNTLVETRYYRLTPDWSYCDELGNNEDAWSDKYLELLSSSIDYRLVGDVPVGTYCSGGVDSSMLTALAAKKHPNISAFNVSFPDFPELDEGPCAERVAQHVGVKLHTFPLTRAAFLGAFVRSVYITEYPLAFLNTVPLYLVSQLARDTGVRVLLSGEGADESLGGYVGMYRTNALYRLARSKGPLGSWAFDKGIRLLNRLGPKLGLSPLELHSSRMGFHDLLIGNTRMNHLMEDAMKVYERYDDPLDRHLAAELLTQLQSYLVDLLHRTDRASMSSSVEARTPMIDHRLLELALAMPPAFKCGIRRFRPDGKSIWKKIACRYLPREIVYRSKAGFGIPPAYYKDAWPRSWIHEGFITSSFDLPPEHLERWIEGNDSESFAKMLALEVWGQLFMWERSVDDVSDELNQMIRAG